MGDTVTPLVVTFGTVVLNAVLDPILIFGSGFVPGLGIEGAAIATFAASGIVGAVLGVTVDYVLNWEHTFVDGRRRAKEPPRSNGTGRSEARTSRS